MQRKYFEGLADMCVHVDSIAFDRKEIRKSCRILNVFITILVIFM